MPEVYTTQNKQYYCSGIVGKKPVLSPQEVYRYRCFYVYHSMKETYNKFIQEHNSGLKYNSFYKIIIGDLRPNNIYKDIPIYHKKTQS